MEEEKRTMALKIRRLRLLRSFTAVALVAAAGSAAASGYELREQSAKALGNAIAGASADAGDVSYMAYNPATIGRIEGGQIIVGLSYIDPEFELKHAQASTALGTPIQGSVDEGDVNAFVPSLAAKWQVNDQIDLGLEITSFWGLKTDYNRSWIGRYQAVDTALTTIAINPVIAFKPTPRLSLAAGPIAQRADARLTNAIDFGTLGVASGIPGSSPASQDGFAQVKGNDWGYGFNVGLIYSLNPSTRIGMAYHSKVEHTMRGRAHFIQDTAGVAHVLDAALGGAFENTNAKADLTTPATANLGVYHQVNPRLAVMAQIEWTQWSDFDRLVVKFDNNTPDSVTVNNWNDSWFGSIGANYRLTDRWMLRGGLAYDQTPIPDPRHRTPRIPDTDRKWLALGATYSPFNRFDVTASWVHLFLNNGKSNLKASDEGNAARGNLTGTYQLSADVFALQLGWRF